MYSVGQGLCLLPFLHLAYALGHAAVGKQHELLYQLVGVFRLLEVAAHGLSRLVNFKAHLLAVELHGAVLEPRLAQLLCQHVERYQFLGVFTLVSFRSCWRRRLSRSVDNAVVFKYLLHLFVGETAVAFYHRVYQAP